MGIGLSRLESLFTVTTDSESLELPTREERVLPYLNTTLVSCFSTFSGLLTAWGRGQLHGAKERQQVNNVVS